MIVQTEGIVLRTKRYGETSKIVTLYTRSFGKISAMAKGARTTKSPYGAALEPLSHSVFYLYKKEGRSLHYLSKASLEKEFRAIPQHGERFGLACEMMETILLAAHDEEENPALFELLSWALGSLDACGEAQLGSVKLTFLLRFAALAGFAITPSAQHLVLSGVEWNTIEKLSLQAVHTPEVDQLLPRIERYVFSHIPGLRKLKSSEVSGRMEEG